MEISLIPPRTNTGEAVYSNYLIKGLSEQEMDFKIIKNPLVDRPNIRIFLGSFLVKNIINDGHILHNLDNLGPFLVNNDKFNSVLTVHDIAPIVLPHIHSRIMRFNFGTILPRLIKNTDLLIVPSNSTKMDLVDLLGVNDDNIEIIPMGVDKEIFYPKQIDNNKLMAYGIEGNYILYVGNDNPRKNLKNLILAYKNILLETKHKLVLLGPINKNNLVRAIKSIEEPDFIIKDLLNSIIMPGYVNINDIPMIYNAASAFVFPSLYEGFGLTPLEAMASNVPVIISDNSSLREVVKNAGLYIENPLDPNEIADKILEVVKNEKLQKKLRKRGLEQSSNFDWDNTVNKTIEVYKNII